MRGGRGLKASRAYLLVLWVPETRFDRVGEARLRGSAGGDRLGLYGRLSWCRVRWGGVALAYWALRRLLQLVILCMRSERSKEIEIVVLRHQLKVLERQLARPRLRPSDRILLAAFSRVLARDAWPSFVVTPAALLRWHRELRGRLLSEVGGGQGDSA
jgi:hypothetical protein